MERQRRNADASGADLEKDPYRCGPAASLTFTSFGRHGGGTGSKSSGLTTLQLMEKCQWSSVTAMANDDDEGKQEAQIKRIKCRKRVSKQATIK